MNERTRGVGATARYLMGSLRELEKRWRRQNHAALVKDISGKLSAGSMTEETAAYHTAQANKILPKEDRQE